MLPRRICRRSRHWSFARPFARERTTPVSLLLKYIEASVSNITSPDQSIAPTISGHLAWTLLQGPQRGEVLFVFLANDETGMGRVSMGNVTVAGPTARAGRSDSLAVETLVVYTLTSLVEQTTLASHLVYDTFASVSNVTFTDRDRDRRPRR